MRKKKFHTLLISKTTIINFVALTTCIAVSFSALKHLPPLPIDNAKIADLSFNISLPGCKSKLFKFEFDFLTRTAVKAAGFDLFSSYNVDTKNLPDKNIDNFSQSHSLSYTEVSASPTPSPVAVNTSNIFEKTLSGKYGSVSVDNKTNFTIDTNTLLNAPISFSSADEPLVLIVHTHSTESYTPSEQYNYTPESNSRTTDKNFNIIKVGDEFEKGLKQAGINVIHDTSLNDYPSYNGSYTKTLGVINEYLKKYPSIKIVLDIHRDSMTAADGTKYKTVTEIDGKKVAQMMIVCGTSQGGLSHPDWQENMKLALKFQSKLNSDFNKIARPLSLRKERFNTHATFGSMIIEVGTDANTLDEALLCASYASKSIAEVINQHKQ